LRNRHYINEKALYFDEISYTNADLKLDDSHVTKYDFFKFKMADGRYLKI